MKFLIAPNAFKGTIAADEAAEIIRMIIREQLPNSEIIIQPIADGGDGTCALLIDSLKLKSVSLLSLDPIGRPISSVIGWDPETRKAYFDVSTASGIGILGEDQKQAHLTSTYGTGILIQKAIELGAEEIVLGLGGSATVDMGLGILQALGFVFLDQNGREMVPFCPDFIKKIHHVQRPIRLPQIKFTLLCDVRNLFFGSDGAIPVFGPQKGLRSDQLDDFEFQCHRVLSLILKKSKSVWEDREGFGAAGGIALGLSLFFHTEIKFGSNYFFEVVVLDEKVKQVDWIVTGEGRYDSQSNQGKACFELLQLAKSAGKKIALITSGDEAKSAQFDEVWKLPDLDFSKEGWKEKARENLHRLVVDFTMGLSKS